MKAFLATLWGKILLGVIAIAVIGGGITAVVMLTGDNDTPDDHNHTHIEVIDKAVPATCANTGLTEGKHCSECGEVLVKQNTTPKLEHAYDNDKDATCNLCGAVREVACDHPEKETVEGKAATCSETGLTDGEKCKLCGVVLVEQGVIPMTSHTYDDGNDADCNACGHVRDVNCAHTNTETMPAEDATCTATGLTEGLKCKDCGEILTAQEEISLAPHTYDDAYDANCNKCTYTRDVTNAVLYDNSEVTIVFYHTMGVRLEDVLEQYIEEFNRLYPNITIIHKQIGGYGDVCDKIKIEITVGKQPNIAYCYPDHVALYNISGAVTTLDKFINSTVKMENGEAVGFTATQLNDFIQGFYNEGVQFGDEYMYTLPFSKSTELLYYNKTFFEEHNLSVPTTWDEMEAVCARIKAIDPNSIPLGYDSEANWFITMCEQLGTPYTSAEAGNHFLFDDERNHKFVARFREWYLKGYVTTQEILGSYTSNLFTNEKCYMSIASSAGAAHQRPSKNNGSYSFEVGIAPIPQADVDNPKVISQGPSLCIFDNEDHQETNAAWLFVKFLTTNTDFQAEFAKASGYVPVINSAVNTPLLSEFISGADGGDNITALALKVCMEQKAAYFVPPAFNGSSYARNQVSLLLQRCLLINKDATDKDALMDEYFATAVNNCKQRYPQ